MAKKFWGHSFIFRWVVQCAFLICFFCQWNLPLAVTPLAWHFLLAPLPITSSWPVFGQLFSRCPVKMAAIWWTQFNGWLESADKIPWLWNFGSTLIFSFLAIDHTSSWHVSEDSWRFPQWAAHEVFAGNFTINWYTRRPMAHRKQQRNARRKIFP